MDFQRRGKGRVGLRGLEDRQLVRPDAASFLRIAVERQIDQRIAQQVVRTERAKTLGKAGGRADVELAPRRKTVGVGIGIADSRIHPVGYE